jgi:tetratricopeptide (TPR) repeat protein
MVKLAELLPKKPKAPNDGEEPGEMKKKKSWKKALNDDGDSEPAALSDLSDSTDDGGEIVDHFRGTERTSENGQLFEKRLRSKHSKGCKAMAVSTFMEPSSIASSRPVLLNLTRCMFVVTCSLFSLQSGNYHAALEEFESILSELLKRYGERHERVGAALHNVAIANLRAGSLDDALDAIEEAIKIRSRTLGRSHPKVADSLVELGIILLSMEEHDDALKVFERALKLRKDEREETFASEDEDGSRLKVAKVLNNIGCVNFEKGDLLAARKAFDVAIQLQKSVFRNWYTFVCGMDMNSPGVLTMASTMCNKGYVEIEQGSYDEAVQVFEESLKIQRSVLGSDNKLVQTTVDNLGYAHFMMGKTEKALKAYSEMWESQKKSNDPLEDKSETLRKVVICYVRMENWQKAFEYMEPLEDFYQELDEESKELYDTRKLMGEVNYQILKLPSLSDATNNALGCVICIGPAEEAISMEAWTMDKPENTSKMSGHRVTHA